MTIRHPKAITFDDTHNLMWSLHYLKANLREEDKKDVLMYHKGKTWDEVPVEALRGPDGEEFRIVRGYDTKLPMAIYGCTSQGIIWFLGTDQVPYQKAMMLKRGKQFILESVNKYGTVRNYIRVSNRVHLKWIVHMGAKLSSPFMLCGEKVVEFSFDKDWSNQQCVQEKQHKQDYR